MKKIARYIKANNWLDQEVVNPTTGNKVKVKSLPASERKKYKPKEQQTKQFLPESGYSSDNKEHRQLILDSLYSKNKDRISEIISHPDVSKFYHTYDTKNTALHHLAKRGIKDVLNHPDVSKVVNSEGITPLHELAVHNIDITNHPDAGKVKDNNGNTPLHYLVMGMEKKNPLFEKIKRHPAYEKVKNKNGETIRNLGPEDVIG